VLNALFGHLLNEVTREYRNSWTMTVGARGHSQFEQPRRHSCWTTKGDLCRSQ